MTDAEKAELEVLAQEIATSMDALNQLVATGTETARGLARSVKELDWLAAIDGEINALSAEFVRVQAALQAAVADASGAWHEAADHYGTPISEALDAANAVLTRVEDRLGSISTGIDGAKNYFDDIGEEFSELIEGADGSVDEALKSAGEINESVNEAIEENYGAFSDQMATLVDQLDQILADATTEVKEVLESPIHSAREAANEAMQQFREYLVAEVKGEVSDAVASRFLAPAMEQIDAIVKLIDEQMQLLAEDIARGAERSAEKRQALKQAIETLEEAIDPVLSALNGLRGLAGSVGISI